MARDALKLLIFGGSGMLGHRLHAYARAADVETFVTFRRPLAGYAHAARFDPRRTIEGVDAARMETVRIALDRVRPTVVVNCLGIVKQRHEAQDALLSLKVNAVFPQELKALCQQHGIRLMHISTDCVFSGRKGNYREDDVSDAEDVYGRTKYLGEIEGDGVLTLRTSIIGRELENRLGLVEWFLAQEGKTVRGFTRAIYSGVTTTVLSRLLLTLIKDFPRLSGRYQVAGDPITKHQLLHKLRQAFRLHVEIQPDETCVCDRSLDGTRFQAATGIVMPSWDAMIGELATESSGGNYGTQR